MLHYKNHPGDVGTPVFIEDPNDKNVEICNIVVRTTTDCLAFMRGRIVGWVSPWVESTNLSKEKIEKKKKKCWLTFVSIS